MDIGLRAHPPADVLVGLAAGADADMRTHALRTLCANFKVWVRALCSSSLLLVSIIRAITE